MTGNGLLAFIVGFPFAGAVLIWLFKREWLAAGTAAVELAAALGLFALAFLGFPGAGADESLYSLSFSLNGFAGLGVRFTIDGFRAIYCFLTALLWLLCALFSREYLARDSHKTRFYFFFLLTLGATEGVFLAEDLFTLFIFFEIMSLASYVWVAQDERRESLRAGGLYLSVSVIGGLVMLMGLFLLYSMTGTLQIAGLREACANLRGTRLFVAAGCVLFGFAAKAGVFPLHVWLPEAHPAAPAPASALLSGILTKTGIFGILILTCRLFFGDAAWGALILILGLLTMVTGSALALFSIDLKRILACSSVSQIGFILTGIGMLGLLGPDGADASRGTLLFMINHTLCKASLFLAAGVVYRNLRQLDLNAIRGFGRGKRLLHAGFLAAMLGICGIPFFGGYPGKTLIHQSIVRYLSKISGTASGAAVFGMHLAEWVFLICGGATLAYMLKIYVALFWEKNRDSARQARYDSLNAARGGRGYISPASAAAILVPSVLALGLGALPYWTADPLLDIGTDFLLPTTGFRLAYFSLENLQGAFISLVIGLFLYVGVVRNFLMKPSREPGDSVYHQLNDREYADLWPKWLNLAERVYRPLLLTALPAIGTFVSRCLDSLTDFIIVLLRKTIFRDSPLPHELDEGNQLTHTAGVAVDTVAGLWDLARHGRKDRRRRASGRYEHKFALWYETLTEDYAIIGRSLSFGLLLALFGLLLTILYVLLW